MKALNIVIIILILALLNLLSIQFWPYNEINDKEIINPYISNQIKFHKDSIESEILNSSWPSKTRFVNRTLVLSLFLSETEHVDDLLAQSNLKLSIKAIGTGETKKTYDRLIYSDEFPSDTINIKNCRVYNIDKQIAGLTYSRRIDICEIMNICPESIFISIQTEEMDSLISELHPRIAVNFRSELYKDNFGNFIHEVYIKSSQILMLIILIILLIILSCNYRRNKSDGRIAPSKTNP